MSKTDMPAAEANELNSYELAFHVLPTVAEGEVATVFESLKALITKQNGEVFDEEAPERFDLAYEIIKYLEGRNRKFTSAYFGWVRFKATPESIEEIVEGVEGTKELLRHLLTKLTRIEEENPFRFHEALDVPVVEEVDEVKEDKKEKKEETPKKETPKAEDGDKEEEKV